MMNLFKLSEQLKDFSKDQLIREMQAPSGNVPQYLVMSELQRRTRMEKEAMTAEPPSSTTVAQDTVAAAGTPQGGIAQMAQALAPKTDMANNTGISAMAPQAAPTQRMQEGGAVGPAMTQLERFEEIQRILAEMQERNEGLRSIIRRRARGIDTSGAYADLLDAPSALDRIAASVPPPQGPDAPDRPAPYVPDGTPIPLSARPDVLMDAVPPARRVERPERPERPRGVDEFSGLPDYMTDMYAEPPEAGEGIGFRDIGRFMVGDIPGTIRGIGESIGFGPAMSAAGIELADEYRERVRAEREAEAAAERLRGGREEYTPEPAGAPISGQPDLLEDMSDAVSPPGTGEADDTGGAGGAGAPGGGLFGDLEGDYETDKWLSLARFGLGLMSSREPTLLGAAGEAGMAALEDLSGARERMRDRQMQQAELDIARMRAAGSGAGGPDLNQLVQRLQDQQEYLGGQLLLAQTPEQQVRIQTQLDAIQTQLGALLGIPAPEAPPVMEARPGFLGRIRDAISGE